ncbi:Oidioi.mRNA.OKI2018_I69.chr2.g6645.t1.cds [Oikopleura dioica]|nr:Oidioi.mRNA.OKI2018_I69.chr2.g6645.t1.cds [Oikopleura dioica]
MELYGKGVVDYHLIVDILPQIVKMIFTGEITIKGLSVQQKAILVALGLQYKSVDELSEISLTSQLPPMPSSQILGHFKRAIIRINEEVKRLETIKAEAELNLPQSKVNLEIEEGDEGAIDAVLDEEAAKIKEEQAKEKQELVKALQQYKIKGNDNDWSQELSTRKSVANISIGRERVEKKAENGDAPVKRKGGKTPDGKRKKKRA